MDNFSKRFEQDGGNLYNLEQKEDIQQGGRRKEKLSPRSENWKKKFLEMQLECKNLKAEKQKLIKKINNLESEIKRFKD